MKEWTLPSFILPGVWLDIDLNAARCVSTTIVAFCWLGGGTVSSSSIDLGWLSSSLMTGWLHHEEALHYGTVLGAAQTCTHTHTWGRFERDGLVPVSLACARWACARESKLATAARAHGGQQTSFWQTCSVRWRKPSVAFSCSHTHIDTLRQSLKILQNTQAHCFFEETLHPHSYPHLFSTMLSVCLHVAFTCQVFLILIRQSVLRCVVRPLTPSALTWWC